ncbi:MAG: DUF420 domain-containing protein [Planctomycetaceae bacterium]|nr:DUF420 domain-containing protein [Planctomycetaceae bacterium]
MPEWVKWLPTINASLNGLATVLLVVGYLLIRRKQTEAHKRVMLSSFGVSVAFLVCYLVYHAFAGSTKFEGTGLIKYLYFFILITHIVLAATVPVLAAITIYRGLKSQWDRHRRIARVTFPIWLYVSVTGVMIYGMLYHWPQ